MIRKVIDQGKKANVFKSKSEDVPETGVCKILDSTAKFDGMKLSDSLNRAIYTRKKRRVLNKT